MDLNDSVVIIDKPSGHTSHEITSFVKKITGSKRSGHAGTLDPNVTGVLPVALGKATKLLRYIAGKDKVYVGIAKFRKILSKEEIEKLFSEFTGEISQIPPKKSAVRRKKRKRKVYYLKLLEVKGHLALFETKVDAGTYIRTLCTDMGKKVGGARMEELRRTAVGNIKEEKAVTMQSLIDAMWLLKNKEDDSLLKKMLYSPDEFVSFKKITVKDNAASALKQGAQLTVPGIISFDKKIEKGERVSIYSEDKFIGVGVSQIDGKDFEKMKKGIAVKTERIHV